MIFFIIIYFKWKKSYLSTEIYWKKWWLICYFVRIKLTKIKSLKKLMKDIIRTHRWWKTNKNFLEKEDGNMFFQIVSNSFDFRAKKRVRTHLHEISISFYIYLYLRLLFLLYNFTILLRVIMNLFFPLVLLLLFYICWCNQ